MSRFTVEKNIPMPERRGRGNGQYPFDHLEPGDSFFIPVDEGRSSRGKSALAGIANKRMAPKRFAARSVEGGVRIWRVE